MEYPCDSLLGSAGIPRDRQGRLCDERGLVAVALPSHPALRRAIKVVSVLATVCAIAWMVSPAWASCGFSIPMRQGGTLVTPAGPSGGP